MQETVWFYWQINKRRDIFFNDDELNAQALAAAERNSKERMANHGKVDIGGGYMFS